MWHVAQWVSRAPPHHTLPAFLNLNDSFQEIWDRYSVEIDAMLFKYSHIPYLMKSLMLIRACGDIALSPMTFELTLDLYKTIQMSNYKSNLESSTYKEVIGTKICRTRDSETNLCGTFLRYQIFHSKSDLKKSRTQSLGWFFWDMVSVTWCSIQISVPTHNSHIFVRPKKVGLFG